MNEQLGFGYEAAHNLLQRTNGGFIQAFNVDAANELTSISRSGTFTVSGATPAPATSVTVNGQAAQTYGDFTFARTNIALANGTNNFTNIAVNAYGVHVTNTLTVSLPTNVALLYDSNGNLTNDGTRSFTYDSENQLTNVSVANQWRSDFVYDGLGRRRIARDYAWQGGQWVRTNEVRYVFDRLLPVQERDTNNNPLVTYTRGLDLSGTRQRAGGIGGLLALTQHSTNNPQHFYYHADALGNITALMDGNENIAARYLYGPFGKLTGQWGPLAPVNRIQFSSMFTTAAGIVLYPGRPYFPELQRWGSRDPSGIRGGINEHRFNFNNPLRFIDPDGRAPQMVGASYDSNIGQSSAQYQNQQFGQGYGIGLHSPPFNPLSAMANDLDAAWNYGLDQITPPIDPNQNPYAYAASQTAREMALAALLAAATDRVGGFKKPCPPKTTAAFEAALQNRDKAGTAMSVAQDLLKNAIKKSDDAASQMPYIEAQFGRDSVEYANATAGWRAAQLDVAQYSQAMQAAEANWQNANTAVLNFGR